MKRWMVLLAIFGLLMVPSTAFAEDGGDETVYNFDGEDVEGALVRPDGEQISGDDRGQTSNLIDVREDFIPEMLESVESLE